MISDLIDWLILIELNLFIYGRPYQLKVVFHKAVHK